MPEGPSREELCRSLGFRNLIELHQCVQSGVKSGATPLLQKKLNAPTLTKLGYTVQALAKLGFKPEDLRLLGFSNVTPLSSSTSSAAPPQSPSAKPGSAPRIGGDGSDPGPVDIRALVNQGALAVDLKRRGFKAHHCKVTAGMSARELFRIGYTLDDLLEAFSPADIKAAGFNAREMSRFFSGAQLRSIGFTAFEMKVSGYTVRDLITFGYNENHIIGAGYSLNELVREGLNVRTVDRRNLR